MGTGVGVVFTALESPSKFPSPTWLLEAPNAHHWDGLWWICSQLHGVDTVLFTWQHAGLPSQNKVHSEHMGCGVGLELM